ncbi:MAG: hypothetical protein CL677_08485 [Bdellovibrionaceae bacterium]|nr:hypothetical protein [Pseudobdellovibrionaceae bacterium]|tara:strand:- start:76033 stop:78315 length:2283 start_codon:yes stop_codon:yes gene_type:complete
MSKNLLVLIAFTFSTQAFAIDLTFGLADRWDRIRNGPKYSEPVWTDFSEYKDPYPNGISEDLRIESDAWLDYSTKSLNCQPLNRPETFKFCSDSNEINMANAYWLSCLSTNAYNHYDAVYKDLKHNLGFGSDNVGNDLVGDLIEKYGTFYQSLKKKAEENENDAAILAWIQMDKEEREDMHASQMPHGFQKTMAHLKWLEDQIVHFNPGSRERRGTSIDFISTRNSDDDNTLGIAHVMDVLDKGGFGFMKFFNPKSEEELQADYENVSIGGTQLTWAEHDDFVVIAVRGTQPPVDTKDLNQINDTITDAVAFQTMFDYKQQFGDEKTYTAFVHLGFNAAFKGVWNYISGRLIKLRTKAREAGEFPKPIFVTGHSLGGALATLLAGRIMSDNFREYVKMQASSVDGNPKVTEFAKRVLHSYSQDVKGPVDANAFCEDMLPSDSTIGGKDDLIAKWNDGYNRINNIKGLYTFGSPRVGDGTFKLVMECFAKKSGTTIARFRNNEDLVPAVPHYNESAILPYVHIGSQVVLGDPNASGFRTPYMETSSITEFPGSYIPGLAVKPMSLFYRNYANDNYVNSFIGDGLNLKACEPGTKCGAHGSPYYLARRDSHPSKLTNNLARTGLKLAFKALTGEADFISTVMDHSMGPANAGTEYENSSQSYSENLSRLLPKTGDYECGNYDIPGVPFTKVDTVFTDELRAETVELLKKALRASVKPTRRERLRGAEPSPEKQAKIDEVNQIISDLDATMGSVKNEITIEKE